MSVWFNVFCSASQPPTLRQLGDAVSSALPHVRAETYARELAFDLPGHPNRPWQDTNELAQIIFFDDQIDPPRYGIDVKFSPRQVAGKGLSWCDNRLASMPEDLRDWFPDLSDGWVERLERMVRSTNFEIGVRHPTGAHVPVAWIDLAWTLAQWVAMTFDGVVHLDGNGFCDPVDRQLVVPWE